jgi:hypothetical protein
MQFVERGKSILWYIFQNFVYCISVGFHKMWED